MIDEEEQPLHPDNKPPTSIRSQRLKKQFQFLQSYEYEVQQGQAQTMIRFNDVWPHHIQLHRLTLYIPEQYPFKQPSYQHQEMEQPKPISHLIDDWSPRYKVSQLIQLIIRRTAQLHSFQQKVTDNYVYNFFRRVDSYAFIIVVAVMLRVLVGLGSYSGEGDYPQLGDFEAHRNWMSITVHKPISEWYVEFGQNPWWRIDYPPGAAYLSYLFGSIYQKIEPDAMNLQQGYESASLKAFMRFSVLLIDSLLLIPSMVLLVHLMEENLHFKNKTITLMSVFMLLIKPDIILIDHGHFQYNSLVLGLTLYSIYFMLTRQTYLCCLLFTIAINCKQMATYYCLGFPFALIGLSLHRYRTQRLKVWKDIIIFAIIVLSVTFVMWLPWLGSMESFKGVLSAIFPIHRGLYQLKVANFWCVSDPLFKWQSWIPQYLLMMGCALACLCLSLPTMFLMMVRPLKKTILIGMANISMCFFLFSYHVHEKSILFPLATIPFLSSYFGGYFIMQMMIGGCVGMYHLLVEDGQKMQYFVLLTFYIVMGIFQIWAEKNFLQCTNQEQKNKSKLLQFHYQYVDKPLFLMGTVFMALILHILKAVLAPPEHLPYLYHYLFAVFGFWYNFYFFGVSSMMVMDTMEGIIRRHKRQ